MIRKQLLIGILAAMTVALPAVGIYAGSAEASEIQSSNEDTVSGNKGASIDKAVTLQNSVKMTDQISAAVNGENIMFSPTSLNFALGMIAEGAEGETKEVLCNYLGTDDFASYAKEYLNKIKEYNTEDESYGYKSKLKIADAVWVDNNLTLQEEFKNDLVIIGINDRDDKEDVTDYYAYKKNTFYASTYKTSNHISNNLKITAFPTFIIINQKGEIVKTEVGFDKSSIRKTIKNLIKNYK